MLYKCYSPSTDKERFMGKCGDTHLRETKRIYTRTHISSILHVLLSLCQCYFPYKTEILLGPNFVGLRIIVTK